MSSPTLNGIGAEFSRLTLPLRGRWHLDVRLMGGLEDLSGPQSFVFLSTTYSGSIFRTKDEAGVRSARIVGGKNGLSAPLPPKAYSQSGQIQLSLVLNDLAAECGETIVVDTDRSLGNAWVRAEQSAARTLDILTGGEWWMAPDGTIHTEQATRDTSPITSGYMAVRWRGAQGLYQISPDEPGDWTPGRTFQNTSVSGTVSRLELDISVKNLEMRVMVGDTDRLQDPVATIVEDVQAALLYHLSWPFTVQSVSPGPPVTMTLLSNDSRMPNLQNVVLWPGPSGAWATPPNGAAVRVRYVAADPGQPEVYGLDPANPPTSVTVAGGGPAIGRVGDSCKVTFTVADFTPLVAGLLCAGSGSPPTVAPGAQPFDITGTITGGSSKVTSG